MEKGLCGKQGERVQMRLKCKREVSHLLAKVWPHVGEREEREFGLCASKGRERELNFGHNKKREKR